MIKNFFNISDLSHEDIIKIFEINENENSLKHKNIGMIFEKYSTRTRLSFNVAINKLGGNSIDIRYEEMNISRDETFEDTFRAMDCYLDGLIYRTNDHKKLLQASQYFNKNIINALSDYSHPCQTLSDLLTIKEQIGSLNCKILWMGDMNNVCFSLVEAANIFEELNLIICTPSFISSKLNWIFGSNTTIVNTLDDIDLPNINCVMTDVFVSMNDKDSEEKVSHLKNYIVTSDLVSKTASNSFFMHCLPAKVGYEVSEEVFRGPKSIVWKQAYNRLVTQKKLLQFIYQ